MKKLGIYGGSFSPPHNGHVKSALAFYDACALDELLVIPAGIPPHKLLSGDATAEDRLNMTKLAFSEEICAGRKVRVDDYEVRKEGRSYTYETLQHFSSPDVELFLLIGSDMFLSLDTWMKPEIIFSLCTVIVNRRETDFEAELFTEKKEAYEQTYGARIVISSFRPLVVSSSSVRALLAEGQAAGEKNRYELRRALDEKVLDYIIEKDLYGYVDATLDALRAQVAGKLSEQRLAHVLSVEKEVLSMSRLLGLTQKETFILRKAALLHDITHELPLDKQLEIFARFGKKPSGDDLKSPAILHQITGALVADRDYSLEKEGVAAISCHTTGKPDMTLLEMALCLADYIEKTRPYPDCKALRRYFYERAQNGRVTAALFTDCMRRYLRATVDHLNEKGAFIHPQTLEALAYYEKS